MTTKTTEPKHYVLKNVEYICVEKKDVHKYLSEDAAKLFMFFANKITAGRIEAGIPMLRVSITDVTEN